MVFLWEPRTRASMTAAQIAEDSRMFRPGLLAFICGLAVVLGIVFLTVPVHFGYLFGAIGVTSPAQIGMAYGLNSLGVIGGTLLFGWVLANRLSVPWLLALGALIASVGFLLMRGASDYGTLTAAGLLNGLGCGILLPTMVTWNMRELPVSRRGMGIGAYQSCFFFGLFINPLLVVGLEKVFGSSRAAAVGDVGVALLGLAVVALIAALLRRGGR